MTISEYLQENNPAVKVLLNILKITDENTYYHSLSVASIVEAFLDIMQQKTWNTKEKECIIIGALLHDIGKAFLPFQLQSCSQALDFNRKIIMQSHPSIGYEIVRDQFHPIVEEIVLFHHEKADGSGYPYFANAEPIVEKDIPLYVTLVSYADILDALITDKPYRTGCSLLEAQKIMCKEIDDNKLSYRLKQTLIEYIKKNNTALE